ncbi:LuxR C-terminal-related transcriptional regulator [Nocardioides sp. YIM 152588]|uniref:helix-turn-helix transcriptional regulator n=1 Tax=Nocardioides sp. YIM 152588 TaxID=3158259 RepID=UPI0032E477DD
MSALVGRDEDLAEVRATLRQPPRAVLLVGEAGVGKTALVTAALDGRAGLPPRVGGALATLTWMPYLPLRRAFPDLDERVWAGDADHVLADLRAAVAAGAPVLVEDLHWADPATLACLEGLVGAVPLVMTVRRGDAAAAGVATRLEKAGASRLDLEPLGGADARLLLDRLRPDLVPAEADALLHRSGGNPLLLEELARDGASESLTLAVLARCRALPEPALEDLATLALAGRPLPAEVLPEIGALRESGIVAVDPGGLAAVRHALIAEVVVDLLSAERRRRCHGTLAGLADHPGEAARHLLALGDREAAKDAALDAVAAAPTPGERWRHLATAAEASDGDGAVLLRARAAEAACTAGEPDEAARLLDGLDDDCFAGPHGVAVAMARATQAFQAGEWDRYLAEVERGREVAATGSEGEALVRAREATAALVVRNDAAAALRLAGEAVALAEEHGLSPAGPRATRAGALAALGEAGWEPEFEAAIAAARADGDPYRELNARHNLVFALTVAGLLDRAWEIAATQRARCLELRLLKRARSADISRLVVAGCRGDHDWVLAESARLLAEPLSPGDRCDVHSVRGGSLAQLGRVEEALAAADALGERASHAADRLAVRLLANAFAGHAEAAREAWVGFGDSLGQEDVMITEITRAMSWACYEAGWPLPERAPLPPDGLVAGHAPELDGLAALAAGRPAEAAQLFADAQGRHGPRRWEVVWCRWAEGEALRLAGDPSATSVLGAAAAAAEEHGYAPIATRCRRSLRALGERPAGPRRTGDDPLTPRERQVVDLVVQGLTDADIADRLGVARRTVQTQLASARAKLGAESRAHLAALAGRDAP